MNIFYGQMKCKNRFWQVWQENYQACKWLTISYSTTERFKQHSKLLKTVYCAEHFEIIQQQRKCTLHGLSPWSKLQNNSKKSMEYAIKNIKLQTDLKRVLFIYDFVKWHTIDSLWSLCSNSREPTERKLIQTEASSRYNSRRTANG